MFHINRTVALRPLTYPGLGGNGGGEHNFGGRSRTTCLEELQELVNVLGNLEKAWVWCGEIRRVDSRIDTMCCEARTCVDKVFRSLDMKSARAVCGFNGVGFSETTRVRSRECVVDCELE